jgi:hypothetical protein
MGNSEHPDDCRVFLQKGMLLRIAKCHRKYSRSPMEVGRRNNRDVA